MNAAEVAQLLGSPGKPIGTNGRRKWPVPCPTCGKTVLITDYDDSFEVIEGGECQCPRLGVRIALGELIAGGPHKSGLLGDIDTAYYRHSIPRPLRPPPVLISDLVPDQCAAVLAGVGGAGKSTTVQTMATCIASRDKPVFGRATEHGRAVFFSCEDRHDDLLWRQNKICRALDIDPDAVADTLVLKSYRGTDCFLFHEGKPTPLMDELQAWLAQVDALRFVGIDSSSLVYGDNENDRREVTKFLRYLDLMAERLKATTMLITHPSRTSDGSVERMTSGSTAWVNQARAALLLSNDADKEPSLMLKKANGMKPGLSLPLRWTDDAVLMPKDADGLVERITQRNDDKAVIEAVAKRWPTTEPLTRSMSGKDRYLPRFMGRTFGWSAIRGEAAMVRLIDARKIESALHDKKRKTMALKAVDQPENSS